jgi:hypothetical protein
VRNFSGAAGVVMSSAMLLFSYSIFSVMKLVKKETDLSQFERSVDEEIIEAGRDITQFRYE